MFDNDKLLFSANNEVETVKEIVRAYDNYVENGESGKAKQQFHKIAKIMKDRINDRYIKPINILLHNCREHPEQSGFIVMVINCILIELYFEMINGFDTADENGYKVKDAYRIILPLLDPNITLEVATIFYKKIRCKIIHQGQTGKSTAITFDNCINDIITLNGSYYLCNPKILFDKLCLLYKEYWNNLSEGKDSIQKSKFVKKFKYVLDRNN